MERRNINIIIQGDREDFEALAGICDVPFGKLQMDGISGVLKAKLPEYRDCDTRRLMKDLRERKDDNGIDPAAIEVCPVAYALSQRGGLDPVLKIALATRHCFTSMGVPVMPRIYDGLEEDRFFDNVEIAPGVVWCGSSKAGRDEPPVIRVISSITAFPDTVWATLAGEPLDRLIRHDDLPAAIIGSVEYDDDLYGGCWEISLVSWPKRRLLHECTREWLRRDSGG